MPEKLVEVKDVEISFGEGKKKFVAVHNANFFINKGETFSLVGESGSGKTTIGRAIIGLNDTSNGEIIFDGKKINGYLSHSEKNDLIRRIQMIFQDPAASLNERVPANFSAAIWRTKWHDEEDQRFLCPRGQLSRLRRRGRGRASFAGNPMQNHQLCRPQSDRL